MTGQKQKPQYKNPLEVYNNPALKADSFPFDDDEFFYEEDLGGRNEKPKVNANPEFQVVFSHLNHQEDVVNHEKVGEIKQLIEQIKQEVKDIKRRSEGVNNEVDQVERVALQFEGGNKQGVYHVRYLEMILTFLRGIKAKVGEAKTWMMAMHSKKAKRGSAFAANTKKKGTSFSMSQELQSARSVQ